MLSLVFIFIIFFKLWLYCLNKVFIIKSLPLVLPVMLAVAFFTLFERKLLASIQRRRGPNVVGF